MRALHRVTSEIVCALPPHTLRLSQLCTVGCKTHTHTHVNRRPRNMRQLVRGGFVSFNSQTKPRATSGRTCFDHYRSKPGC